MRRLSLLLTIALAATACAIQVESPTPTAILPPAGTTVAPVGGATQTLPAPNPSAAATRVPGLVSTFPNPQAYTWAVSASGLELPDDIQFPDDGTGRMFVLEQPGRIRVVDNGQVLGAAFLDIADRVGSGSTEQGLLGLAFHPDFKDHPYFYVNYTDQNGNTVIARFEAHGNVADPSSEKDLVHIDQPFPNHNGGELAFGPDGYLYLGLGDGGSAGDPLGNAQNTDVLLGKILRIDVDHGDPYGIPATNPFAHGGGRPEIWAYGLRNPWRFSFDRYNGDLYIADVGQDLWEEVDVAVGNPPGLNYGWNYFEGLHPYAAPAGAGAAITMPVVEYSHAEGGCAIVGGYVYAGQLPEWRGIYLYGDYCSGKIWGLIHSLNPAAGSSWQSQLLFETEASITSFGQDAAGEVYFANRAGTIYRLQK